MILSFLFYFFLFYLGYRLLFNFIIPVIRTTMRVKKGFREMKDQAMRQSAPSSSNDVNEKQKKKVDKEDYIDFEEIR